jgi:hypothetical protein
MRTHMWRYVYKCLSNVVFDETLTFPNKRMLDRHLYTYLHKCVLIPLYMCPHTSIYVFAYLYICVRMPLYMCPHASIYVSA